MTIKDETMTRHAALSDEDPVVPEAAAWALWQSRAGSRGP